jgi:hypothetical protein
MAGRYPGHAGRRRAAPMVGVQNGTCFAAPAEGYRAPRTVAPTPSAATHPSAPEETALTNQPHTSVPGLEPDAAARVLDARFIRSFIERVGEADGRGDGRDGEMEQGRSAAPESAARRVGAGSSSSGRN